MPTITVSDEDLFCICSVLTGEAKLCAMMSAAAKSKMTRDEYATQARDMRSLRNRLTKSAKRQRN